MLEGLGGLTGLEVAVGSVTLTYEEASLSRDAIVARIREAGYQVRGPASH